MAQNIRCKTREPYLEKNSAARKHPEGSQALRIITQILPVQDQDLIIRSNLEHLHDLKKKKCQQTYIDASRIETLDRMNYSKGGYGVWVTYFPQLLFSAILKDFSGSFWPKLPN